jgi:hypothetical protein
MLFCNQQGNYFGKNIRTNFSRDRVRICPGIEEISWRPDPYDPLMFCGHL